MGQGQNQFCCPWQIWHFPSFFHITKPLLKTQDQHKSFLCSNNGLKIKPIGYRIFLKVALLSTYFLKCFNTFTRQRPMGLHWPVLWLVVGTRKNNLYAYFKINGQIVMIQTLIPKQRATLSHRKTWWLQKDWLWQRSHYELNRLRKIRSYHEIPALTVVLPNTSFKDNTFT